MGVLSCDNATCPVYTSAALIPSFPPFPPQTPHNCVSPPHSQLIDTCATPFRAPDPAIMLTDTMMPLCRIVPASYQEYPKYMLLSCDNATCPVYTSAALIPSFPPFPPQTPHNCVSPPHSQLIDTCATPFRAPGPAIMLTDTMMPLCRIVPASYQEYPKYMPGICSSTPDLFNAASTANLLLLLPL